MLPRSRNRFVAPPGECSLSSFLACNSYDCVARYVDIILHRGRFWAKSAASGSLRCCFRSCWTVLSHVMRGRPSCLLQSAGGEANRILLASALSSMRICPNRVSQRDWIIAVNFGCFVSLRTSSFRTNWYHLMPSSMHRHHWWMVTIYNSAVGVCEGILSRKTAGSVYGDRQPHKI